MATDTAETPPVDAADSGPRRLRLPAAPAWTRRVPAWAQRWWPLIVVTVPLIVWSIAYIKRTYVDVLFLDAFIDVPYVGEVMSGHWSLGSLLAHPFAGEHLLLGYRLIDIINAKLFSLDKRVDPVLFVVASTVIATVVFAECRKIFAGRNVFVLLVAFAPMGFLAYSLVSQPGLNMTTQYALGTAWSLVIMWLLQRDLDRVHEPGGRGSRLLLGLTLFAILVYFALLSGSYFSGLFGGLAGYIVFRGALERRWLDRQVVVAGGFTVVCAAAYLIAMITVSDKQSETSGGLKLFFTHPWDTIRAYLAALAGSLNSPFANETKPNGRILVMGLIMLAILIGALWMFVRTRMYRRTYLPIFLVFYTFGVTSAVVIGRGEMTGWRGIGADWYAPYLRPALIGIVWMIVWGIVHYARARPIRRLEAGAVLAACVAALAYVAVWQRSGNDFMWKRAPSLKAYYQLRQSALLFPQDYADPSNILLWPDNLVRESRAILRKYKLSMFSSDDQWLQRRHAVEERAGVPRRSGDWYPDGWVGRKGTLTLPRTTATILDLNVTVPAFVKRTRVTVVVNGATVFNEVLRAGESRHVAAPPVAGRNVIVVRSSKTVTPADAGLGADKRALGVLTQTEF